jgi:hypothetical protein
MKATSEFLFWWSEWAIAIGFALALYVATEVGYRLGQRALRLDRDERSQIGALEGAVLGLVGLLLAFSFGMAGERFATLKVRVGEEVLASDRAFRRAGMLEEPLRSSVREAVRAHLDARIALTDAVAASDRAAFRASLDHAATIDRRLSELEARVGREAPGQERTSLVAQSIDDLIESRGALLGAVRGRLPSAILFLLLATTTAALVVVGYANGIAGGRARFGTTALQLIAVLIVLVIIDFDRPGRGLIQVPQDRLVELRDRLQGP